jgi:PAS domain S-box-containing protein
MDDAVLVVAADGTVEAASDACAAMFGWDPADLVGRSIDLLVPAEVRATHELHRGDYSAEPASRPMGVGLRLRAERRDGSLFDIDVALTPFDDRGRVLAVVRDESERAAVRAEKELVQRLLDAMSEGVFMFLPDTLELTHVNDGAVRQTGYTRQELTGGMTPLDVMVNVDEVAFREMLRPLLDGGVDAIEFEAEHRRKDGVLVPVDILLQRPAVEGADEVPVVALSRDVSERRAAEAERDRQQRWLESLNDTRLALLLGVPADDVLALVCDNVRNLTDASVALVVEPSPDGKAMSIDCTSPPDLAPALPLLEVDGGLFTGSDVAPRTATAFDVSDLDGPEIDLAAELGVTQLLVAPLRVGAQSEGLLVVGRGETAPPWSATDAELLSGYALEAATALELARSRVENQRLVMLEDRERIAADLHDMVIQRLFAAGMRLQGTMRVIDSSAVSSRIGEVVDDLDATIDEIRQAIFDLHAPDPGSHSLESTVRDLVADNESYLGFTPTLAISGEIDSIPVQAAEQLIPVITEALSNVARHAHATEVEVTLTGSVDGVELTVSDDGVGISAGAPRGKGLQNMARRARGLGGRFETGPGPAGKGTSLRWVIGDPRGSG